MARVLDKQNIFDVVLQESGGINNAARVLRDNGLNFNDSLISGDAIEVGILESAKIKENYELIQFKPNNWSEDKADKGWILENGFWTSEGKWTSDGIWKTA